MTDHERVCFNDALHKARVRETEIRIRRKLDNRLGELDSMQTKDQLPYLFRLEEVLAR